MRLFYSELGGHVVRLFYSGLGGHVVRLFYSGHGWSCCEVVLFRTWVVML